VVQHQWTVAGNVDGLRIDPTGLVWARQNNDGNSTLTTISPISNATQFFTYGNTYYQRCESWVRRCAVQQWRDLLERDDPASPSDPILLELTYSLASPPLQLKGLLAAGAITDPDSLILMPNGDLALTGEADQTIVFIHNPGTAGQTVSYLPLLGVGSGLPDDTAFPNSTQGLFFYADTGANLIYEVSGFRTCAGLRIYRRRKNEFGSLNTSTGLVTPIFTGVSPHGLTFVPTPEPSSLCALVTIVLFGGADDVGAGLGCHRTDDACTLHQDALPRPKAAVLEQALPRGQARAVKQRFWNVDRRSPTTDW
jgi:hypothetical protein